MLALAAVMKVALLAALVAEQYLPFATPDAPVTVAQRTAPAEPAGARPAEVAGILHQPLTDDIALATGIGMPGASDTSVASGPATAAEPARGPMSREGVAWAADAKGAPQTPPAGGAAPAGTGTAQPAPASSPPAAPAPQGSLLNPDALNRRQEELNRREQELKSLEHQIDGKLAQLQDLEARIQTMLKDAQGMKDDKLRHLVDVYTNMKAKQAAAVLETLDEKIAVRILAGMRGRQAGEILTFVQAEKAARLSEALTRMQLPLE